MIYDPKRCPRIASPKAMRRTQTIFVLRALAVGKVHLPAKAREDVIAVITRWFRREPDDVKLAIVRAMSRAKEEGRRCGSAGAGSEPGIAVPNVVAETFTVGGELDTP